MLIYEIFSEKKFRLRAEEVVMAVLKSESVIIDKPNYGPFFEKRIINAKGQRETVQFWQNGKEGPDVK